MTWREKRRAELDWLGVLDPALLVVRYGEVVPPGDWPGGRPARASLTTMIEAILDQEEAGLRQTSMESARSREREMQGQSVA